MCVALCLLCCVCYGVFVLWCCMPLVVVIVSVGCLRWLLLVVCMRWRVLLFAACVYVLFAVVDGSAAVRCWMSAVCCDIVVCCSWLCIVCSCFLVFDVCGLLLVGWCCLSLRNVLFTDC